ncbi:MAG: hypothetical protein WBV77_14500, partial [Solirubrobacteraceae bacterium]
MTTPSAAAIQQELRGRHEQTTRLSAAPLTLALGVAIPLALAYLILAPPAGDLAAATYRSDLFARVGLTTWDTGWYAAHGYWLPGYSLLSPALGALLGVRLLLALSAVAACTLFALIAQRVFATAAARLAAAWFALGFCVGLLSGRVPYDLGFAIGLASVLALMREALPAALVLAVLTSVASPVAGAFLGLAGLAIALADLRGGRVLENAVPPARAGGIVSFFRHTTDSKTRRDERGPDERRRHGHREIQAQADLRRGLALCAAALLPVLALGIAYPNGGYEPFAVSAFWPALAGVLL